ncbi:MAG: hypothetical protein IJ087_08525 [Eggerthellaceae bacterium]|nr:hypothetical protein [Eggerthellaceae bacterium]
MQVGVTNPLREFLKWKAFPPNEEADPFYCWDAHRVKVDGRVMLVVCNAANRFAGVMAMRATDWKRLGDVCRQLVGESLYLAGFAPNAVEDYLARAGEIEFGRTHGRKAVGCMNRMVDTLLWCECDHDAQLQPFLMHVVNVDDVGSSACHEGYGVAAERMAQDMLSHGIDPFGGEGPFEHPDGVYDPTAVDRMAGAVARMIDALGSGDSGEVESAVAELDRLAASGTIGVPTQEPARSIDSFTAQMLAERGLAQPWSEGCRVCGGSPRVYLNALPYCLDCYNDLAERMMGIPHVTNDHSAIVVFDPDGAMLQFSVERIVDPVGATWTAREVLAAADPRAEHGYEGVEVSIRVPADADQDEALGSLWEKAQQAVGNPSTHVPSWMPGPVSNGAHVGGEVRFANDVGWGRLDEGEDGATCIVVDGQRYTGEQFLDLLSANVGFDLHWRIADHADPLPEQ